jgi:hypothetical protein
MKTPQYEYRVSWVDDDWEKVDDMLKQWAEAGWELVSGGTSPWVNSDYDRGGMKIWHTRFVMYWRRKNIEPVPNG